ncbi:GNAT family N-acetyltransferase [Streptomyces bambusae]|nr:GNAT family N-acetyltransferase [Streptomyces bambusae]
MLASIRRAGTSDIAPIDAFRRRCSPAGLHLRWGRTRVAIRDIERLLAAGTTWLGLDATGQLTAVATAGRLSGEPRVVDLGLQVADAEQQRGIGTLMAYHAAAHARSSGAHTLSVYTAASNTPILRLLHRLGPATQTPHGSHVDVRVQLRSRRTPFGPPPTVSLTFGSRPSPPHPPPLQRRMRRLPTRSRPSPVTA